MNYFGRSMNESKFHLVLFRPSNSFQCDVISMSNSNFHPITGRKSETTIPRYIGVSLVSKTIGGSRYTSVHFKKKYVLNQQNDTRFISLASPLIHDLRGRSL